MQVEGRYLVQVRLNGYTNPTGKCNTQGQACFNNHGNQICCDSDNTNNCWSWERCDSYFVYCLRPLGEVHLGCTDNEKRTTSHSNEDDESDIDFSENTVLGLSNPQNLSGLGDAYKVSYYMHSWPSLLPLIVLI